MFQFDEGNMSPNNQTLLREYFTDDPKDQFQQVVAEINEMQTNIP
jgi:hypothetical protein